MFSQSVHWFGGSEARQINSLAKITDMAKRKSFTVLQCKAFHHVSANIDIWCALRMLIENNATEGFTNLS